MRIITRTVFILSLVSLLGDIASEMLYPVIPVYLREIGFTVFWIGLLEGVANFTAGISKGYFGKRSDETGHRLPFVRLGYLLSAVSKPLIAVFSQPVWVFLVRTADRLGKGVRTAARDAMLAEEGTPATRGRIFGFHRALDTLGAAIGPLLALVFLFLYPGHYTRLFYFAFIPGLLSVALVYVLKEKKRVPERVAGKGHFFSYFSYWKTASTEFRVAASGLLAFALFNSSDFFLLLVAREAAGNSVIRWQGHEFNADLITIAAYVLYNLVYALLSYPLGALADRFSPKKVIMAGLIMFTAVYTGFALHPGTLAIFLLFILYGIYAAATDGVIKAWITNTARGKNTATAIGFYTSCESICTLLAGMITGLLWTLYGSTTAFLCTAFISLSVFIWFILRKTTPAE